MRPIQNKDLFRFIRMIKDAGISAEFKKLILSKDSIQDFNVESMGLEVMYMFAEGVADENIEQKGRRDFACEKAVRKAGPQQACPGRGDHDADHCLSLHTRAAAHTL